MHKACLEIIETLAFYPEHIDVGKKKLAWVTIDLLLCYKIWRLLYRL